MVVKTIPCKEDIICLTSITDEPQSHQGQEAHHQDSPSPIYPIVFLDTDTGSIQFYCGSVCLGTSEEGEGTELLEKQLDDIVGLLKRKHSSGEVCCGYIWEAPH